jgi:hypothetical protein
VFLAEEFPYYGVPQKRKLARKGGVGKAVVDGVGRVYLTKGGFLGVHGLAERDLVGGDLHRSTTYS